MSARFSATALVVPFENLRMTDVEAVGGKNASLGEMISQLPHGVRVPTGFATTAHAALSARSALCLFEWAGTRHGRGADNCRPL